jgi:hypothetical protein
MGSKIVFDAPMELLGDMGPMESCFGHYGDGVCVVQDRCLVCAKRTTRLEIILDAPDGTPRLRGSSGSSFWSIWR